MKNILTTILLAATLTTFSQTTFNYQNDFKIILAKTKDAKDKISFDKLLIKFKSNETPMTNYEVLALLIGYTDNPDYKPYQDLDTEREIYKLNGGKKHKEALDKASKFLKTHPVSLKGLFEISYAFHKLGKEDSASFYLNKGRQIIEAMRFSGDGKTKETPIFALSPTDGQDYISKNGASVGKMGSGKDSKGNFLDILEAKLDSDKTMTLYFIIEHAKDKMMGGKSIKEELEELEKKDK